MTMASSNLGRRVRELEAKGSDDGPSLRFRWSDDPVPAASETGVTYCMVFARPLDEATA